MGPQIHPTEELRPEAPPGTAELQLGSCLLGALSAVVARGAGLKTPTNDRDPRDLFAWSRQLPVGAGLKTPTNDRDPRDLFAWSRQLHAAWRQISREV